MSNTTPTPPTATPPKPRPNNTERGKTTPPANRRISQPVQPKKPDARRDMFGIYFLLGATGLILLFGAIVYFVRSYRPPAAVVTPTPTVLTVSTIPVQVEGSPIAGFTPPPAPTLAAPDAINSGPYAQGTAVSSQVGEVNRSQLPPVIPGAIPQAQMDLSETALNFGNISASQIPNGIITLANPSGIQLVIHSLWSDCECVTAQIDAGTLKTGERARLNIQYNPATDSAKGGVTHKLSIVSTDGQHPQQDITLTANVQ